MAAPAAPAPETTELPPPSPPTNPESKQTIHVVPPPIEPGAPPKPGSARERMHQELRKRAGAEDPPASAPSPAKPEDKTKPPISPKTTEPEKPAAAAAEEPEPTTEPAPATEPKPGDKKGDKRVSPWKLVDEYKAKNAELEKQLVERAALPEKEKKEFLSRIEEIQKRNEELEDAIRFVNYRKSKEFQTKYQEPYQKAWSSAISELREIPVIVGEGQTRPATAQDMLNLVNLPLAEARTQAEALFGPFANDVMAHRKTIKQLWDTQAQALEEAEKNGAQREKEQIELSRKRIGEIQEQIDQTWQSANETATKDEKHGKYFLPIEGDEEGNQKLAKGYELVDRAFRENPKDPNLTAEQRKSIINRHAAVRNRAAAYGRLVYLKEQAEARISELEKELDEIKSSTPPGGGDKPATSEAVSGSAMDRMKAELRKRAQ